MSISVVQIYTSLHFTAASQAWNPSPERSRLKNSMVISENVMSNAIAVIFPYRHNGTWVFDDERVGLVQEPFVSGVPEMIDILVEDIKSVDEGFKLLFSGSPFPGYQAELIWLHEEYNGHWYLWGEKKLSGWLCPALFKYFETQPNRIYCKAESLYR